MLAKLCLVTACLVIGVGDVSAQKSLQLREAGTNRDEVQSQIGQPITVEVLADLCEKETSGISVFITVPRGDFAIVDQRAFDVSSASDPGNAGTNRSQSAHLFEGAGEARNLVFSSDEAIGVADDQLLLLDDQLLIEYQAAFGKGPDGTRTGIGVVATFQLLPMRPVENALIRILNNPIHETRVVLAEGGDRHFESKPKGMQINVLGEVSTAVDPESWASIKAR